MTEAKFQIGKNGLTSGVLTSLALAFKNHKQTRITVLKSFGRDRYTKIKLADQIAKELSKTMNCTFNYKIIGFKIVIRKHYLRGQK